MDTNKNRFLTREKTRAHNGDIRAQIAEDREAVLNGTLRVRLGEETIDKAGNIIRVWVADPQGQVMPALPRNPNECTLEEMGEIVASVTIVKQPGKRGRPLKDRTEKDTVAKKGVK
ncbi:hypothetical protein AGMMS50255_6500 [Spirochaetia bacterium]|nr:hypothetical protein AGMMS50255_6500 [Spirochaetia bacterium]